MADKVNLQKSYSTMNEKLVNLFDESGVRRTFTVPYLDGQPMDEHIQSVSQAAAQSGGLTSNLLLSAHHSGGKGWGSGEGQTVAHPSEKLRTTNILPKDENAKAAVDAAQTHLNGLEKLLGPDDPTLKTAQSQLNLVKRSDGAGMSLLDFGVLLTQIMYQPHQTVARLHSGTKDGGHAPHLRAPGGAAPDDQGSQPEAQGAPQGDEQAPADQNAAPMAQAAPAAPAAAPAGAPADQQAQG